MTTFLPTTRLGRTDMALTRAGFGDARTLTIPPNAAHEGGLARLQSTARAARRGLWGACL